MNARVCNCTLAGTDACRLCGKGLTSATSTTNVHGDFVLGLKPWDSFVEELHEVRSEGRYKKCGIACPECGEELLMDTMVVLTTYPPQRGFHCPKCDWKGTA